MTVREQIVDYLRRAENKRAIHLATGIDPATLTRIALGERQPSGEVIDALAAYFGLELRPKKRQTAAKRRPN